MYTVADGSRARDGLTHPEHSDGGKIPVEPPAGSTGGSGQTRVTVNLNRQAVQALDGLSEDTGYTKTDVINRALQIYKIVHEIMERDGGVLTIKRPDGQIETIRIV